jgi:hypothetical protein
MRVETSWSRSLVRSSRDWERVESCASNCNRFDLLSAGIGTVAGGAFLCSEVAIVGIGDANSVVSYDMCSISLLL